MPRTKKTEDKEKIADKKLGEEVEETLEGKGLEKAAKLESLKTENLEEKKKRLLEKAAKLKGKIDVTST